MRTLLVGAALLLLVAVSVLGRYAELDAPYTDNADIAGTSTIERVGDGLALIGE